MVVQDGAVYFFVSGMVSKVIFKLFEAVFRGEAPFIIKRIQRIIMHSGYQLCFALTGFSKFPFFTVDDSAGTFFLKPQTP